MHRRRTDRLAVIQSTAPYRGDNVANGGCKPTKQKGVKTMGEWIDTRECVPLEDGYYLIQTVFGAVNGYTYTHAGGWNTHYDHKGNLCKNGAINDGYVARWFDAPKPKEVPEEWYEQYLMKE